MSLLDLLRHPWPWYIAGPVIGLMVPLLLWLGNHAFGISSNLRHVCAAVFPGNLEYLRYDWKRLGGWNLVFLAGVVVGGFLGGWVFASPVDLATDAYVRIAALGLSDVSGLVPREIFSWSALFTPRTLVSVVGGGLCVGFGTAWAGGCTSGHGITGLASFDKASLIAVLGFFAGGLLVTWFVLPVIL